MSFLHHSVASGGSYDPRLPPSIPLSPYSNDPEPETTPERGGGRERDGERGGGREEGRKGETVMGRGEERRMAGSIPLNGKVLSVQVIDL